MREDVRDAIESARTCAHFVPLTIGGGARERKHSAEKVRAIVLAVLRELPDDMTVVELRDELEPVQKRTI